jgi:hypothetical protein
MRERADLGLVTHLTVQEPRTVGDVKKRTSAAVHEEAVVDIPLRELLV